LTSLIGGEKKKKTRETRKPGEEEEASADMGQNIRWVKKGGTFSRMRKTPGDWVQKPKHSGLTLLLSDKWRGGVKRQTGRWKTFCRGGNILGEFHDVKRPKKKEARRGLKQKEKRSGLLKKTPSEALPR